MIPSGLPSQLRDAVLASVGDTNTAIPESDVGKEWQSQRQVALLNSGQNPWENGQTPNEMLLDVARSALHDREQHRVKITVTKRPHVYVHFYCDASSKHYVVKCREAFGSSHGNSKDGGYSEDDHVSDDETHNDDDIPLPPGISDEGALLEQAKKLKLPASLKLDIVAPRASSTTIPPEHAPKAATSLPPRPPGPPPASAFKNKAGPEAITT